MKRKSSLIGALVCATSIIAFGVAAMAQSVTSPDSMAPQTQQKPIQASQASVDYIQKAAIGDLFEIQSSELALKQADSPAVKAFAQQMITDHATSAKALESAVKSASLQATQIPNKLDPAHQAKLDDLRKVTGRDFDSVYIGEQLAAHKEALKLHRDFAEKGDNPVLKKTAANAADIAEHHLQEAQKITQMAPPQSSSTGSSR